MLLVLRSAAALAGLAALAASAPARAQLGPLELRLEPGASFFASGTQQARYGPVGVAVGARAALPAWRFIWVGVGASYVAFPFPTEPGAPPAGALALGLGVRASFQPAWLEAAIHGVGTGPNFRFGYELGAGGDLAQLGPVRLGPFVRFLHVLQPDIPLQDPASAIVLTAGVSISLQLGHPPPEAPAGLPAVPPAAAPAPQPPPREEVVVVTRDRIQIKAPTRFEAVRFESGGAQISRESYAALATVAKVIFLHPEIRRLRVEGHTDAREGGRELAGRRAEAVRKHLVEVNGVEADRLEAVGYGADVPVAGNETPEGRAQNRRVEFFVTERADDGSDAPK